MNSSDLRNQLEQFTGTENYYFHPLYPAMKFTDGIQYLAKAAGCLWLLDIIGTEFFRNQATHVWDYFVVIKLSVKDRTMTIIVEDGNDNEYERRHIEYTDFPEGEWALWLIDGVLILPSEY